MKGKAMVASGLLWTIAVVVVIVAAVMIILGRR